ncbi:carcinoembryonic antigen-related cell adhesion molecule 21-like isoform X2 [Larimichthys crocea]|uniref:carcinoembryonic antigen-related cell adhesion molecule 21-like isoform X2 n=1 Tax=Larimichthys crocea TaxID=215358 RepID=UPI000F5D5CB5|nr:carcinoembryonic antigen-related cell adhesion molecule 21-like isoform X2 [Larimichthys crocea]
MKNHHILTINDLKKNDSAEYTFRLQEENGEWKQSDFSGVTLVVTVVTEGQRVTLTCSTSCPLSDNTNYIWSLNSRPLTLPENQYKQLVLDPVSSQHAGRYSCAVKTGTKTIITSEKTLTVKQRTQTATAAAGAAGGIAVLLVIIALSVFLWIRQKRTSQQSPGTPDNTEELNMGPLYEDISAQPEDQEEHYYSTVNICKTQKNPIYSQL